MGLNALFPNELNEYNQSQSDRKLCYQVVLIMLSDIIDWFTYSKNEEIEIDYNAVLKASEIIFFVDEFDELIEIFPNAETFFERDKFLIEE